LWNLARKRIVRQAGSALNKKAAAKRRFAALERPNTAIASQEAIPAERILVSLFLAALWRDASIAAEASAVVAVASSAGIPKERPP
jgi:hypothetical protein